MKIVGLPKGIPVGLSPQDFSNNRYEGVAFASLGEERTKGVVFRGKGNNTGRWFIIYGRMSCLAFPSYAYMQNYCKEHSIRIMDNSEQVSFTM